MFVLKKRVFLSIIVILCSISSVFATSYDLSHVDDTTSLTVDRYYDMFVSYVADKTQHILINKIQSKLQAKLRRNISLNLQKKIKNLDEEQKIVFQAVLSKIVQQKSGTQFTTDDIVAQRVFINAINVFRQNKGLSQLQYNSLLSQVAYNHANDMYLHFPYDTDGDGNKEIISHVGTNGMKVNSRVSVLGYNYSFVAENIGYNQQTVDELIVDWENSPMHYANLIAEKPTDIGVAKLGSYRVLVLGAERLNR